MNKKDWLNNVLIVMLLTAMVVCVNTSLDTKVQAVKITKPLPINQLFPDPGLAEEVKKVLKKASVTDIVSQKELNEVREFNGNDCNIKCLEGLQFFIYLKELYLCRNQISDLSPLEGLTNLVHLCVDENKLENLNGIPSTKLARLFLDGNELRDVSSLSHLTELETLSISKNKLRNIDALAHLTKLKVLDLRRNELRDLSALASLKKLTWLDLACQKCINKPLAYEQHLMIANTIKCPDGTLVSPNFISDNGNYMNASVIWNLPHYTREVNYTFGKIVKVGKTQALFNGIVLQPLYKETSVLEKPTPINQVFPDANLAKVMKKYLKKKHVTEVVSQIELDKLEEVQANDKDIQSIEGLQYLPNLIILHLADNQISDIRPLEHATHLIELCLDSNELTDISPLAKLKELEMLSITNNKVRDITLILQLKNLRAFYWDEK
ncbi:leucine-rich repeat protein [Listeria ivanovii subsp. londoniensis]|uniref:Leucine-rich repeat protein n=1 Tax=Listeria ivanovii subsp. londoniensis TaxID=202752 RepID=A0ABS1G8X7_LISIV|nr:leucine-rich repeat protein [Listeria ivanovii subsp. londoniensis]